jgi:hypothetical protein
MFKLFENKPIMKYLYICFTLLVCISIASCSKKGDAMPTSHTIKFTATGTASFTAVASVIKATATTSTTLDTKTVATGTPYDYSTSLNSGDIVHFEIQTMGENSVSYTITDNGTAVTQQTNKELVSFSKTTADYTIN